MPRHIDAAKLPAGLYWRATAKGGVWWRYKAGKRDVVATETAMLSDLHAVMESDSAPQGSVNLVMAKFHGSTEFSGLADGTKGNYLALSRFIAGYQTKLGVPFGMLEVDRLNTPVIQRLIEAIAKETPTKANHVLRYMRRTFAWGIRVGLCKTNPARGVKQAKERRKNTMPGQQPFADVLAFAKDRGQRVAHTDGSVPSYLWAVMELAYGCRLRGIEAVTLTDANALEAGIMSKRRKGSLDNVTRWNGRLREAWAHLEARRRAIIDTRKLPTALSPELRFLVVAENGQPITKSGFDSAWQRMIKLAVAEGIIEPSQRFSLHGLKHRGVTDTKGTRADRREASGHKTESAFGVYDHAIPVVEPAEFFS
jgi:site-specific recombinase XerD